MLCAVLGAAPARAATQVAQVNANVVKPLTIKWIQDLDLGTIVLGPGGWSGATIALSQAGVLHLRQRQRHLHRRDRGRQI